MAKQSKALLVPDEKVISKILLIRGKKVMLDRDLAELYGVTTTRLNEQVKRNAKRFPSDFMFKLTKEEKQRLAEEQQQYASLRFSPVLWIFHTIRATYSTQSEPPVPYKVSHLRLAGIALRFHAN